LLIRRDFDQGLAAAGAGDSAGIKARLNPQAFQALSQELVGILSGPFNAYGDRFLANCRLPDPTGSAAGDQPMFAASKF
jgi:hypothetical protein